MVTDQQVALLRQRRMEGKAQQTAAAWLCEGAWPGHKRGGPEGRLAEGAAKLGWDQQETAPGLHRFLDHVRQAGD